MSSTPKQIRQHKHLEAAKRAGFKNKVTGEIWDERNLDMTITREEWLRNSDRIVEFVSPHKVSSF